MCNLNMGQRNLTIVVTHDILMNSLVIMYIDKYTYNSTLLYTKENSYLVQRIFHLSIIYKFTYCVIHNFTFYIIWNCYLTRNTKEKKGGGKRPWMNLLISRTQWIRFKSGRRTRHRKTERECVISQGEGDLLTIMLHVSLMRQDCRRGWKSTSDRSRMRLSALSTRIAQTCLSNPLCIYVYTR